jgi:AcrR family transcriptional regulator
MLPLAHSPPLLGRIDLTSSLPIVIECSLITMARPTVIRDETIIDAARAVFLARGIRATTAEVAERAGVSEGSIFKRFKSKVELFQAAMGAQLEEPEFLDKLAERVGHGDFRDNLFEIGTQAVAFFRTITPLMMMAWSNPGADGLPCMMGQPNPPPLRILKKLTSFFEAEMRAGRLRRHDPEIIARMFLGSINNFVAFEILLKSHEELPMAAETFVRGLCQTLWLGIAPASAT